MSVIELSTRATARSWSARRWGRWLATFIGFPLAGVTARAVAGNIDDVRSAVVGGLAGGAVLGAVQVLGGVRAIPEAWVAATAGGFALGLTAGAAIVDFQTDAASLTVLGLASGAGVGMAQAVAFRGARRSDRLVWAAALPLLWAGGWAVTSQVIVDADRQHAVFGSSGALLVTAATGLLLRHADRVAPLAAVVAPAGEVAA